MQAGLCLHFCKLQFTKSHRRLLYPTSRTNILRLSPSRRSHCCCSSRGRCSCIQTFGTSAFVVGVLTTHGALIAPPTPSLPLVVLRLGQQQALLVLPPPRPLPHCRCSVPEVVRSRKQRPFGEWLIQGNDACLCPVLLDYIDLRQHARQTAHRELSNFNSRGEGKSRPTAHPDPDRELCGFFVN